MPLDERFRRSQSIMSCYTSREIKFLLLLRRKQTDGVGNTTNVVNIRALLAKAGQAMINGYKI